jgi:hypothetical protein
MVEVCSCSPFRVAQGLHTCAIVLPFMAGSQQPAYEARMLPARAVVIIAMALAGLPAGADAAPASPAREAEPGKLVCLSQAQRRELVAARKVVPLATALRAVRGMADARVRRSSTKSDIINARLCRGPDGLVYRLTVLARDGKVVTLSVDAVSGKLVGGE